MPDRVPNEFDIPYISPEYLTKTFDNYVNNRLHLTFCRVTTQFVYSLKIKVETYVS